MALCRSYKLNMIQSAFNLSNPWMDAGFSQSSLHRAEDCGDLLQLLVRQLVRVVGDGAVHLHIGDDWSCFQRQGFILFLHVGCHGRTESAATLEIWTQAYKYNDIGNISAGIFSHEVLYRVEAHDGL